MRIGTTLLFITLAGCGGATAPREPDEYTGCATDEHWITFDDQASQAVTDDSMAPAFTMPTPGATLPFSPKPILSWKQDPNDPGMAAGNVPYMDGPGCSNCCPQFNTGALTTLHLPAISGDVYDLQFSIGGKIVHRVITTLQEWTPPDSTWASWKGKTVQLKIVRMTLLRNDVKQGPYIASTTLDFSVAS